MFQLLIVNLYQLQIPHLKFFLKSSLTINLECELYHARRWDLDYKKVSFFYENHLLIPSKQDNRLISRKWLTSDLSWLQVVSFQVSCGLTFSFTCDLWTLATEDLGKLDRKIKLTESILESIPCTFILFIDIHVNMRLIVFFFLNKSFARKFKALSVTLPHLCKLYNWFL